MTVVVYRNGTLAADRFSSLGNDLQSGTRTKIYARNGRIFGGCGPTQDSAAFQKWVEDGEPVPKPELDQAWTGILVESDGTVKHYDCKLVPFVIDGPYFAIGNGDMVAYGAMFMGASAEDAVRAACAHVLGCGGGVDVLRLASPEPPPAPSVRPAQSI